MRKLLFILAAMLLSSVGLHAGTQITYTASERLDGNEGSLNKGATTFGPAITSHTFSNGTGTITCSGEITKIGNAAFSRCEEMTSVTIPNTVTTIELEAFYRCIRLASIVLPNSVTAIGDEAFFDCYDLQSITISNAVTTIGKYAFFNCGLISVTIPNSVTTIKEAAFCRCSYLTSIEIPFSVTSIESATFNFCHKLKTMYCYAITPPSQNGDMFLEVPSDISVYVLNVEAYKEKWKELAPACFKPITPEIDGIKYEFFVSNGCKARVIGKDGGYTGNITIPEQVTYQGLTFTVTEIEDGAFTHSGITSITLPPSITKIGMGAFEYCGQLQSIILPSSLSVISNGSFQFTGLTSITIPASVERIGSWAFQQCPNLKEVIIPSSSRLTFIGEQAFYNSGLTSITIPASVERIGSWAFQECPNLKEVIIPSSSRLTSIESYAFSNCSALTSIIIPNSVTKIGERAFWGCGLTSVTIPASVKEIGFVAFKNCTQLKDLQFADRTNPIDIGSYAFENTALTAVDIPNWMTEIPEGLFYLNSKLEAIYLSAFVRKINQKSFGACANLKYIVNMSETPPELAEGAFEGHDKDDKVIVYVPTPEATVAYKDSKWGEYFTKIYSEISYNKTSSRTVEVVNAIPAGGKVIVPPTVFYDGSYLKVTGIADSAFYDQDSLVSISLPSSIQYIGNNAFNGCTKLKDINIEFTEDLQTIGDKAFYNTALDTIVIPEGVQSLGKAAFMECSSLTYVSLPTGLKNIPDDCFRHCYNLKNELVIPEGVDTIGVYSFNTDTSLKKVSLPSSLKELRYGAFAGTALLEVTCLAPTPPTLVGSTFGIPKGSYFLYVYVPNRDVLSIYEDSQWGSNTYAGCVVIFDDLMAKENKAYLYEVAGNNEDAKAIAQDYCDSIDNATSAQDVQQYTNIALGKIDGYTINDYKQKLADSLINYANGNAEAKQIAILYGQQILNAYFRQDAEQLFKEGIQKINDIFDLIKKKIDRKQDLMDHAKKDSDQDLIRVATEYGALIDRAETIEEVETLYIEGYNRITANRSIKTDWSGDKVKAKNDKLTCTTTPGYINH